MFLKQELKEDDSSSLHIKEKTVSMTSYLDAMRHVLDSCDHILITTLLPRDYLYFCQWEWRHKSLLLLHDLHYHYASDENMMIPTTPRQISALIKYKAINYQKSAARLVTEYRCLVCAESMLQYAKAQQYDTVVDYLDLGYSPSRPVIKATKGSINIVIPGSISSLRRDYQAVIDALARSTHQHPISIILAGSTESTTDEAIISSFRLLSSSTLTVVSYDSELSHEAYLSCLAQADYLLLPIRPNKDVGIIRERYGYSSHSGALHDLTRYGTRTIIPAHYPHQKATSQLLIPYDNAETLTHILSQCTPREKTPYQYERSRSIIEVFTALGF